MKIAKKISVVGLSLVMLIQSSSALFFNARSIALLVSTLYSMKIYAADSGLLPQDKTQFFGTFSNEMSGLFDQNAVEKEKQSQSGVNHKDKIGVEQKSGEQVNKLADEDVGGSFNLMRSGYVATQVLDKNSSEYKGLTANVMDNDAGNIFTGSEESLCQGVTESTPSLVTEKQVEQRSCSMTNPPDISPQECLVERNFRVSRGVLKSSAGNVSLSNNQLSISGNIVNSKSVDVAKSEQDIEPKQSVFKAVVDIENANLFGFAKLVGVNATGKVSVTVNGTEVFQEGAVDYGCSPLVSTCADDSEQVSWSGSKDVRDLLVNGQNEFVFTVESVVASQKPSAVFSIETNKKLHEFKSDLPAGCSTQTGSTTMVLNGFEVPVLNLSQDGELLPSGALPDFKCTEASNTLTATGSTLMISPSSFPGQIAPLFAGDKTTPICYRAYATQAAYIGNLKVCDVNPSCDPSMEGKTYADISKEANPNEECEALEKDKSCQYKEKTCLVEEGGICQEWEKTYDCEVVNKYTTVQQDTKKDCGIPICDHDGNCSTSVTTNTANFAKVASQLSIMQFAPNEMESDLDGVNVKIFKGESRSCRSMQLYGLGNNCCKGITGVSAVNVVSTLYQISKNQWVREQFAMGVQKLEMQTYVDSVSQGYEALADGLAETWDTVTAPFQEAYASMFESTTSAATSAVSDAAMEAGQNAAGEAIAETGFGAALEGVYQAFLESAREFLVQDLGLSETTASLFIESTTPAATGGAATGGATYSLGAVFTVIGYIYMIYVIAKLIIDLVTACKKSEMETQYKALTASCIYQGQRCTDKDFFGTCLQKKKYYCCFNSPLARIVSQQGGKQIGKPNHCGGFTPEELGRMDFDKINLGEWTKYLQQASIIPTAEKAQQKFNDKFMQANMADSVNHAEYSLSSERLMHSLAGVDTDTARKEVQEDIVVHRSAMSADGVYLGNAKTIYEELPEEKEWTDVLIAEGKSGKNSPKIFTYKFPEEAGYRLVWTMKKPADYPEKSSGPSWYSDDSGNLLWGGQNQATFYGDCKNETKNIIRKKNAGEVFSVGGYAERVNEDDWMGSSTEVWACDYDVKIYKRVLK